MKSYRVFVQIANERYCHDIVSGENESETKTNAINTAKDILNRYKGDGVYCFVYVHDENFNIVYEGDNIGAHEEHQGTQITLDEITHKNKDNYISLALANGLTKEGDKKFMRLVTRINGTYVNNQFEVYVCDKAMCKTLKTIPARHLTTAINTFNSL